MEEPEDPQASSCGFRVCIDEPLEQIAELGVALLPTGPQGRKSMFNGLADSIWTGSKNQAAAWDWLKYAASVESETLVGSYGVVYPAVPAGAQASVNEQKTKLNVDPEAYLTEANTKGGTFPFPITENSTHVNSIMQTALQAVFTGKSTAQAALGPANTQVNQLFH